MMNQPVRVNTTISHSANEWLNKKSKEMALTKSSLINIAIENYRKEVEVVEIMPKLQRLLETHGIKVDELVKGKLDTEE